MKKILSILAIALITSCGTTLTGYDFHTTAIYQASNSNLQVDLVSTGHVPPGEDVENGQATGTITGSTLKDTIFFQTGPTHLTDLTYKKEKIEIKDPTNISGTISACLDKIGYLDYDKQELQEFGRVIQATTYGPKGTFLDGQTKLIKVISVDFQR